MWSIQFGLLLSSVLLVSSHSHCPEPSSIHPCKCSGDILNCSGVKSPDQFHYLIGLQAQEEPLHFKSIVIDNSELTNIPSEAFGQAIAKEYHITNNKKLTSISPGFLHDQSQPTTINLSNNKLTYFPFHDLKDLKKIQYLIFYNNRLTELPSEAFKDVGPDSVIDIILSSNNISKVGREAFAGRKDRINAIVLNGNNLEHLTSGSLCLDSRPRHFVFASNQISRVDADAFGDLRACGTNFAVETNLAANKLTSLRLEQFASFLRKLNRKGKSSLVVAGNPLVCDCHMQWLIKVGYGSSLVQGANCQNFQNRPLFSLTLKDLEDCLS